MAAVLETSVGVSGILILPNLHVLRPHILHFTLILQICFTFFLLAAKKQLSFLYLLYEEVLS